METLLVRGSMIRRNDVLANGLQVGHFETIGTDTYMHTNSGALKVHTDRLYTVQRDDVTDQMRARSDALELIDKLESAMTMFDYMADGDYMHALLDNVLTHLTN